MRRKMILLTVVVMCALVLSGCQCKHVWMDATCETPQVCSKCDEISGAALGHRWENATCTTAEKCKTCGKIRGDALGHTWSEATCTLPETCSVCGEIQGEPLGHIWTEANYQQPKTCSVCEVTEGEPKPGIFAANGREIQPAALGVKYAMTVGGIKVSVSLEKCAEIEPEGDHKALDGYQWLEVTTRMEAEDDLAKLEHSMPVYTNFTDYYDIQGLLNSLKSQGTEEQPATGFCVNYEGTDYPDCILVPGPVKPVSPEDSENGVGYMTVTGYVHIPQDYDGFMLVFGDNIRLEEEYEGDQTKLFADENTIFLRIH